MNLDREQFLFICQERQAHSKYVSTFDIDKTHANECANKAVLLRFWEMAKEAVLYPPKTLDLPLISHKAISFA